MEEVWLWGSWLSQPMPHSTMDSTRTHNSSLGTRWVAVAVVVGWREWDTLLLSTNIRTCTFVGVVRICLFIYASFLVCGP